ncbi:MAG: xanthine dehydrogenase family protein molybdopterin-binding subunit [Stappiaceae bacterium]
MTIQTNRRNFLKGSAAAATALVIGLNSRGVLAAGSSGAQLNPFVKIGSDGTLTVVVKHFEMGQGTTTGLTTLIAEELDVDWDSVKHEFAPADGKKYANLLFGAQGTGGSTAMANSYKQYRQAGAAAREILIQAAAQKWNVDPETVTIESGILTSGDKKAHFGEVAEIASTIEPSKEPRIKGNADLKLIGNPNLSRKDGYGKTNGSAQFAMDVKVPGMVYAAVIHSPKFGGKLTSFDAAEAKSVAGFIDAKAMPNNAGIVVYGKNTWAIKQAKDAIVAEWDFTQAETRSSDIMIAEHLKLLEEPQYSATKTTDFKATTAAIDSSEQSVEAEFVFPFLAHAPMEPLNCVIEPTETGVRVHDGCQFPGLTQPTVAAITGLKPEQVEINTVFAGGSFGRRANPTSDYQAEAAMAFAMLGGKTPIKMVWMREDDIQGGYFRPMAAHRVKVGIDDKGKIAGWDHRIAAKSIMKGTALESFAVHDGVDHSSVEGISDTHYGIPGFSLGLSDFVSPVSVLWWRSVGHTHTAFALESAIDMVAEKAGRDPVEFRLELLAGGDADQQRLSDVLKLAAEKSGWDDPLPEGRGRGVALHKSFGSYVAEVIEVSLNDGAIKIEKVTCAVDCGIPVNPDVIKAQMEGGIGYGLGAAMRNQITFTDGLVDQDNFPTYEPIRMSDMPDIDVHIVPSTIAPTGVGEPGTPPSAPALANAIKAATGLRVTRLPLAENGVEFA